jgi:hypothetical protein
MWDHDEQMVDAEIRKEGELMTSFKHVKTEFTSDEGEVNQGLFIDKWMHDECMRTSNNVAFAPSVIPLKASF